jgi:hypothetical protein
MCIEAAIRWQPPGRAARPWLSDLPIADWQTGSYGYYDVITWLPPTKPAASRDGQ